MSIEVNASIRKENGTDASRRLRRAGKVPAILYGSGAEPESIELNHQDLYLQLSKEAFYSSILNLKLEGKQQLCIVRDVQRHPVRPQILHVDFQRVSASQKLHQKVPLHFINADIAPGIKIAKGMLQQVLTELNIECLPQDLPAYIEVDLKDMQIGSSLHLSQVPMPKGVEPIRQREEDPVIVTIVLVSASSAADEGLAAEATPETQVITEKKTEDKKPDLKKDEKK